MGRPAARVMDATQHGSPLQPGPGSPNVLIGRKPAWRGLPAAAATALQAAQAMADTTVKAAEAASRAAAGTPGAPAALAAMTASMNAMTAGAAAPSGGVPDMHACPIPTPVPPHGPGLVIDGSQTVLVNGLPLCRQGDPVLEALGGPDKIAIGEATASVGG